MVFCKNFLSLKGFFSCVFSSQVCLCLQESLHASAEYVSYQNAFSDNCSLETAMQRFLAKHKVADDTTQKLHTTWTIVNSMAKCHSKPMDAPCSFEYKSHAWISRTSHIWPDQTKQNFINSICSSKSCNKNLKAINVTAFTEGASTV